MNRSGQILFSEGLFSLNRGVQFLSLLLGLFLQEKSGRGLGFEKDQIFPVHLLKWKETTLSVWFFMGNFWSARCLLQDSASLSILVALRLNISVKFCQGNQAIVLTWLLHMRPRLYLTWIAVQFWSAALLLSTTQAHLVTVKRTGIEHPHCRQKIWVVLLLLFCWSLSVYRLWKAAGSSVFCLSALFLWFALPRLCGLWTCFMGWQQWLLHNQGSGNNPPVLKSSIKLEMESFNDGTVCVSLCGWVVDRILWDYL